MGVNVQFGEQEMWKIGKKWPWSGTGCKTISFPGEGVGAELVPGRELGGFVVTLRQDFVSREVREGGLYSGQGGARAGEYSRAGISAAIAGKDKPFFHIAIHVSPLL